MQIFIFGYYGWENTGDDAMLYTLLQELPQLYYDAQFVVLSPIPVVIPPSVTSKVRFVKPAVVHTFREIAKSQIFIIGGGTHIHDYGKSIRKIKVLLRLLIIIAFARISCNKIYLIGNGIGPISTRWGKVITKFICHMTDKITVRDETSYQVLETFGLANTNKAILGFDIATLLTSSQETEPGAPEDNDDKRILGICVTSVFEIYYGNKEKDSLLINKIAATLNEWLSRMPHLQIHLFIFKGGIRDSDVPITGMLKDLLKPAERINLIPYNPNPRQMLNQVAQCSAFIGTKYHACLFAYIGEVPLLIIDYHPKCQAFAQEIGLPEHAIISLHEILNGQFSERFKYLLESPRSFQATLPINIARIRAKEGITKVESP